MSLSQALLPEYDQEMATTRRVLERVTDGSLRWKPHPKSWDLGSLATHVSSLPGWTNATIGQDHFDLEPPGAEPYRQPPLGSRAEILAAFDKVSASGRAAIAAASDAELMGAWSLLKTGKTLMTLPRIAVLRSFVLNHLIHHRGQLTVYLRLNDIPVPSIYGPSADEGAF